MRWFLVIYLYSSDDLLIKEYGGKRECIAVQREFKEVMKSNKDIKDVTCERGDILDGYSEEI